MKHQFNWNCRYLFKTKQNVAAHIVTTTCPDSSGPLVHYSHPFKEGDIKYEQTAASKMAQGGGREVAGDAEQQVERWAGLGLYSCRGGR